MLQASDFHYELPPDLIAQEPLPDRSGSRMLVVDRPNATLHDDFFANLPHYLHRGDCLVVNDTRVFGARLRGRREATGAQVEIFLLEPTGEDRSVWEALARPGKRARPGDRIQISDQLTAVIEAAGERGQRTVRLESSGDLKVVLEAAGEVPLPPYINRLPLPEDRERYQTVFANQAGSAAAPTAGLHFTSEMLERCGAAGAALAAVTLHVGLGTFAPLPEGDLQGLQLHRERFSIGAESAAMLRAATRRLCIGTTSVRALESALLSGTYGPYSGTTNLFIKPPFPFQGTGAMLTNFHLPSSSLLILVCAFAGTQLTMAAYRHAVSERYRFFSYGDCMLVL